MKTKNRKMMTRKHKLDRIEQKFGEQFLKDYAEDRPLKEIAKEYKISYERARQIYHWLQEIEA